MAIRFNRHRASGQSTCRWARQLLRILGWEKTKSRFREQWESFEFTRHNGRVWRAIIACQYGFCWGMYGTLAMHQFLELVGTVSFFPIVRIKVLVGSSGMFLSSLLFTATIVAGCAWLLLKRGFAARKRHRTTWCAIGALGLMAPALWGIGYDILLLSRKDLAAHLLTQAFCMAILALFGAAVGALSYAIAERCAAEHIAECDAGFSAKPNDLSDAVNARSLAIRHRPMRFSLSRVSLLRAGQAHAAK